MRSLWLPGRAKRKSDHIKKCSKCKVLKSLDQFHRDRTNKDGLQGRCAACTAQMQRTKKWGCTAVSDCECKPCVTDRMTALGLRYCPNCDSWKSFDDFYKRGDGRCQSYCMKCGAEHSNKSRKKRSRERSAEERSFFNLKRRLDRFSLTMDELMDILDSQDWKCVCGDPLEIETMHIDHDHSCCPVKKKSCGRCVRLCLCNFCNLALGMLKDDPNRAIALAAYLIKFRDISR